MGGCSVVRVSRNAVCVARFLAFGCGVMCAPVRWLWLVMMSLIDAAVGSGPRLRAVGRCGDGVGGCSARDADADPPAADSATRLIFGRGDGGWGGGSSTRDDDLPASAAATPSPSGRGGGGGGGGPSGHGNDVLAAPVATTPRPGRGGGGGGGGIKRAWRQLGGVLCGDDAALWARRRRRRGGNEHSWRRPAGVCGGDAVARGSGVAG